MEKYEYKYIDLEVQNWLSNIKNIGLEEEDIKVFLNAQFPYIFQNFNINIAIEIDYAYSGMMGKYLRSDYENNIKKGTPLTIEDIDYKVVDIGLYTFNVYEPDFDPYLEPIG